MAVDFEKLVFDAQGLIPAVIQDWRDGTVLMVGFMSREALEKTLHSQSVHFWSRSRKQLWKKGETSGNQLLVKGLFVDCDGDTILVKAQPSGPICHTGQPSCFFTRLEGMTDQEITQEAQGGILEAVYQTILARKASLGEKSYVASLFQGGQDRILKKIGEEAGEVLLASKNNVPQEIVYEATDLLFHLLIVLGYHDIPIHALYQELGKRFGRSGIRPDEGLKDNSTHE